MKTILEKIDTKNEASSFSWLIDPKLNHFYFWHFHPEYELVYIEANRGVRHVGEHVSEYVGSDLVLIGSNIPHLNFDYGLSEIYYKVVLHINKNFFNKELSIQELKPVNELFDLAKYGVVFGEKSKKAVAELFKNCHKLRPFEQFLTMLQIFKELFDMADYTLLHKNEPTNVLKPKESERINKIYRFVQAQFSNKIKLSEVANLANMTEAAFCRYFKKMTKLNFVDYLNQTRINEAKKMLAQGNTVSDACYACGFESLSYFNRCFKKVTGENPSSFQK